MVPLRYKSRLSAQRNGTLKYILAIRFCCDRTLLRLEIRQKFKRQINRNIDSILVQKIVWRKIEITRFYFERTVNENGSSVLEKNKLRIRRRPRLFFVFVTHDFRIACASIGP